MTGPREQGTSPLGPPCVAVVGRSGSGKTTLLVRLVRDLVGRGVRLGTIKHGHHPCRMDVEGKDSWRHKDAGAERSLLVSPGRVQLVADVEDDVSPSDMIERYFRGLDLVLLEGFKGSPGDKIEVVRSGRSGEPMCSADDGLVAVVTDLPLEPRVPRFGLDDVEAVADFVQQRYLR